MSTLDLLILETLTLGPQHGYGILRRIHDKTDEVLRTEQGLLYPALHRLEARGWVTSAWSDTEHERRTKLYRLGRSGRRQLEKNSSMWSMMTEATRKILALGAKGA